MRNRLAARLQRAVGIRNDPLLVVLVAELANANYPAGAHEPRTLKPIIEHSEIRRLTQAFLDNGAGTIGGLYHAIWGMSANDYVARLDEKGEASRRPPA